MTPDVQRAIGMCLRLSGSEHAKLGKLAAQAGLSRSDVLRQWIRTASLIHRPISMNDPGAVQQALSDLLVEIQQNQEQRKLTKGARP